MALRPDDDRLVAWVADVSQWFPELDNPWRGPPWTTWSPDQFGPEVEP
ncbi:hypothetical protein [Polyangium mundeleinium]|uniref:Uncharacterized protein n=1 Tax=Polyangium mundeleinium TaxID=2995306 RepID=A0ABT5EZS0_9BACT|nr:hypothetical protein [Polyangium mundeleinium]MDC0746673.1 hypothetical protein [Polyangium mundeleinium]